METVQAAGNIVKVPVEQQIISGLPNLYSSNDIIVAHESGNANNTGANSLYNEVAYMTRNWQNAFVTHWVGSGGKVIQLAPTGRQSWGAGSPANSRAYAQVELARTKDKATFQKDYKSYVNLLRQLANQAGIPIELDSGSNRGIKTHRWITYNWGGTDHIDPYSYLASWGITEAQFKHDIKNGIQSVDEVESKPQPSTPNTAKTYTVKAGDTLSGIGAKTGVKWQNIASYNSIKAPYTIFPNQVLKLTGTATTQPSKPNTGNTETGWVKETGRFYMDRTINIRSGAGTNYSIVGQYHAGQAVNYDSYKVLGGYVWIHYISYSGHHRYMAIRPHVNGQSGQLWGVIR